MFKRIKEAQELFNTSSKSEYILKDTTHLVYVVSSIEKFESLKKSILLKYSDLSDDSVNREFVKLSSKISNYKLLKSIMCAELLKRNELKKDIENYVKGDFVIEEMQNLIKSKDDGLEYAVSLGILDDYINYLDGYNYSGPKTKI